MIAWRSAAPPLPLGAPDLSAAGPEISGGTLGSLRISVNPMSLMEIGADTTTKYTTKSKRSRYVIAHAT
jgi:hypothetical protein